MRNDLKQILAVLSSDFDGPVGPIPVERLVRKHLRRFEDLRGRGLTWEQISRLLFGAGVMRGDGLPFPPPHLRGVFGRQKKRLFETRSPKTTRNVTATSTISTFPRPARAREPRRIFPAQAADAGLENAARTEHPTAVDQQFGDGGSASRSPDRHESEGRAVGLIPAQAMPDRDRAKVLALMRQSASARRAGN